MVIKREIYEMLESVGSISTQDIIIRLMVSAVIGVFIMLSYKISHAGTLYSRKFNITLLILTVLTCMVMAVIGNNVALSLGMVGALSIIRFRTAIKDSRDTTYIFWTIIVGICCGVGDFVIAGLGSSVIFGVLLVVGAVKNDNRVLLIIRSDRINEMQIESIVYNYYNKKAVLRVKNTTSEKIEFIYELTKKVERKALSNEKSFFDTIYELSGIDYVNLVEQNDEIGS